MEESMKWKLKCLLYLIFFFISHESYGQWMNHENMHSGFQRATELRGHMLETPPSLDHHMFAQDRGTPDLRKKKPAVGILLSAVIPGTGEFYAGTWLKGILFLGVEATLWFGYAHYTQNGEDWEDTFHDYANTHWSEPEYWTHLAGQVGLTGVTTDNYQMYLDQLRQAEADLPHYTHGLPETKTQQYFEMIGKYDQFKAGWDDWEEGNPDLTPNRNYYEGIRHESNVQFKRASYCAMFALGNHLLSIFDTAWTIRRINRQVESKMRLGLMERREAFVPCVVMNVNW
jgi:hypothetical protein